MSLTLPSLLAPSTSLSHDTQSNHSSFLLHYYFMISCSFPHYLMLSSPLLSLSSTFALFILVVLFLIFFSTLWYSPFLVCLSASYTLPLLPLLSLCPPTNSIHSVSSSVDAPVCCLLSPFLFFLQFLFILLSLLIICLSYTFSPHTSPFSFKLDFIFSDFSV